MPSANYPQLARGVWLGVWAILRKTPSRKLDDRALAAELGVQPTAAKAYAKELMKVGILDDECRPTSLANRWRQDGRDTTIIQEILEGAYPQELRDLAPIGDTDREKVIRWFMNDGLGEGSAKNRAATYIMLSEGVDEEASSSTKLPSKPRPAADPARKQGGGQPAPRTPTKDAPEKSGSGFTPELAVNVQIHISADASVDQIEAIFASMKKHFS